MTATADWSDAENDLIVADYFSMLEAELAGLPYNKAAHRRALQPRLDRRSEGSIEFKHQNISAVMLGLGQPWIEGYKPASRFQGALIDAVLRWLDAHPDWLSPVSRSAGPGVGSLAEDEPLWIGPPPTQSNLPPPIDLTMTELIARKCDVAARDAANHRLGEAGEVLVLHSERATLRANGRQDLAERVRWVSREDGDGVGYDIASFEAGGAQRLIEVKTTNGWERTPFHISRTELAAADQYRECCRLVRVWNFARVPKAFEIRPPLEAHVSLTPTSFLAAIR